MKPSFRQKFRYWFDNLMSRGTPAMIGSEAVLRIDVDQDLRVLRELGGLTSPTQSGSPPYSYSCSQTIRVSVLSHASQCYPFSIPKREDGSDDRIHC
jgi:hypothetical protein